MDDYDKFQELLDCCLAEAIENSLVVTQESIYQGYCRAYSKTFHTPLHLVYHLDPKDVIKAILEERYSTVDVITNLDTILDAVYTLEDPEYVKQKEVDMGDFAEAAAEREQKRIKKNRNVENAPPARESKKGGFDPAQVPKKGGFDPGKLNPDNEG